MSDLYDFVAQLEETRRVGDTLVHQPKNHLLSIDEIFLFVSVDEDGNEGVCAANLPRMGMTPMIAADPARLRQLIPWAEQIAEVTGTPIKLIRLSTREELKTIKGKGA